MIFEVPLADHQLVYLRGESTIEDPIIWVTVKGFWKIWAPHHIKEMEESRIVGIIPNIHLLKHPLFKVKNILFQFLKQAILSK